MRSDLPSHVPVILRAVDAYDLLLGTGLWLHVGRYRSVRSFALRYGTAGGRRRRRRRRQSRLLPPASSFDRTAEYLYLPTYLTLPTYSRTCDYPYRLQKLREGGILSSSTTWLLTATISSPCIPPTSYPRTKSLIIPNIRLSPHLSTKARAKPSKQKTVDPPPRNIIRKTGPNHATGRTTSHPIPPFHHQPLSSPLQQKKRPLFFSETGKGKTLACLQGWKKKLLPVWP